MPALELVIERSPDHARVGRLGVAQLAGLVDCLAGQAEIRDGRDVPTGNIPLALAAVPLDLAPLLRRVVFVGQPALGLGIGIQSVCLYLDVYILQVSDL